MLVNVSEIFGSLEDDRFIKPGDPRPVSGILKAHQAYRGQFLSRSLEQTRSISEKIAGMFIPVNGGSSKSPRRRLGISGVSHAGKTVFSAGLIEKLGERRGLQFQAKRGVTSLFNVKGLGALIHYDAGGYRDNRHLAVRGRGVEVVEHPSCDENPLFNCLTDFDVGSDENSRLITVLTDDETAHSPLFEKSMNALESFRYA